MPSFEQKTVGASLTSIDRCVGAKKEEDIYEAVENLRRRLEKMGVLHEEML